MVNEAEEGRSPDEAEDEGGPVKSFLEHLEDLRWMLVKSAAAVSLGVLICLLAGNYVVAILMRPLQKASIRYPGNDQVVVSFTLGGNRLKTFNLDVEQQEMLGVGGSPVFFSFTARDILQPESLARSLGEPGTNAPAKPGWWARLWGLPAPDKEVLGFIRSGLSPKTKDLLNTYNRDEEARLQQARWWRSSSSVISTYNRGEKARLQQALADEINRYIAGPLIYDTNRFAKVKLSKATARLLAQKPEGSRLTHLNRELLLDALPGQLSPVRFVELQILPVTIANGTNQTQVLGFTVGTNADVAEHAQHMSTQIFAMGPAKSFLVGFHVAVYGGIALASPFLLYFIGSFVLPALRITERRYLFRGLAFAIPLFFCGVSFCYFVLLPAALAASQVFSNWYGWSSDIWEAGDYISFVCKFLLGMGLGFELPVLILVLVKIGLLSYRTLAKARPYMIVINLVLGAVLTTPEVFTQVLMAIPLQVLFEISVWIAWYWERQDRKRTAAEAANERAARQ